jgi:hypothetical protein
MHTPCPLKPRSASVGTRYAVLGLLLLGLVSCVHLPTRSQSDDTAADRDRDREREKELDIKTVGDFTDVDNAQPIPISGVGLVVGLEGTGGKAPPGDYRALLESALLKERVEHVKEILDSSDASLVLVSAMVPAGAHKGDPLDVEITLPEQSRTTSLQGGYLRECLLYDTDSTKHLMPNYEGANRGLRGHALASASGSLLVGFGAGDDALRLRRGRIWGGGRSKIDRPIYLTMKSDQQFAPLAQRIADRANAVLQGNFHGPHSELATAKNNQVIVLRVPEQYKHNLPRYLRVVRLVPMSERPEVLAPYKRRLAEDLLNPKRAVTAALRLEALGGDSIETLKKGLTSDHVLVRFCAAEALAYLGSPSCGEELAHIIEDKPALRAFGLTALASMDEAVSHVKLRELLNSASTETRYGAFRALRALDERDPSVRGEEVNESFWVHRVAPHARPLVHVSYSRRAEVVLFGDGLFFQPPFSFLAGDFTVTASANDDKCTITRLSVRHGKQQRQCSLAVYDVLKTLGDLGGMYPQVVELLRQANTCQSLTCGLAVDALPQGTSVYYLAQHGLKDPDFGQDDDGEIRDARDDFLSTPTLFDKYNGRRPSMLDRDDDAPHELKPKDEKKTANR